MAEATKDTPVKETSTKKKSSVLIFALIAILVIAFFAVKGNYNDINDYFNPPSPAPVVHNLTAADVILYHFDALSSNHSQNVEIWILNNGEQTAKNISVFVRTRDQQGRILYEGNLSITSSALRKNESCTSDYTVYFYVINGVDYSKNTSVVKTMTVTKVSHTVEIKWDTGRNIYKKEAQL